ncbi:glycosyltransferase family 4 protein [Ornithinimicrobium sp. W1679]|uniref:glycosyltransferase family 4 protein n=1 Tax=Ornithinimicrobium sp. W1679 TaxID=3418770 RepID=UPI003CEF0F20
MSGFGLLVETPAGQGASAKVGGSAVRIRHVVLSTAFAGVERHICLLANAQVQQGHDVEVWGGKPEAMGAALDEHVLARPAPRTLVGAGRVVSAGPVDILHSHMTAAEVACVTAGWSWSVPVVATRHFAARRGASVPGRLASGWIGRRLAAQIAVSRYVAAAVDGTSEVVYPGVEEIRTAEAHDEHVVLVVQRLQPEKDTESALRAFAEGAPDGWRLKVVGDGPEKDRLYRLAQQLGIETRTAFLGFRNDVHELMRSAAVLIAPCPVEGLGLSVLEAMSHGLPVVASDAGAHPETVGRAVSAELFTPGDADQAGEQLRRLCADPQLRQRYGQDLRSVQRKFFTPEAQAQATEEIYRVVSQ